MRFQPSDVNLTEIVRDPTGTTVSNETIRQQLNIITFPAHMAGTYSITLSNLDTKQTSGDLFANFPLVNKSSNGTIFSVLSRLMPYIILINIGVLAVIVGIMLKNRPVTQVVSLTTAPTSHTVTYTPNAGFSGTDTFTYKAIDGQGVASNIATVTITINAPAPALLTPVRSPAPAAHLTADNKTIQTNTDTPILITLTGTDPIPGDVLKFSLTSLPQHGELAREPSALNKVECRECKRQANIDVGFLEEMPFTKDKITKQEIINFANEPKNNVDKVLLAFLTKIEDKTYNTVEEVIKAIKDSQVNPDTGMVWKGLASAVIGFIMMSLILFVYKPVIPVINTVPNYVLYLSIVGVLLYFGIIASDKTHKGEYRPGIFIPEFTLRISEAPVFMAAVYLVVAVNVPAINNTGALAALAIFVGLYTRTLEEFFKGIGTAILKPLENYVGGLK